LLQANKAWNGRLISHNSAGIQPAYLQAGMIPISTISATCPHKIEKYFCAVLFSHIPAKSAISGA
jgi:hypothetical protein